MASLKTHQVTRKTHYATTSTYALVRVFCWFSSTQTGTLDKMLSGMLVLMSIRVPQSTAPSSKQSHHFSALLPPIVAAVVLLFDGVRWNLLAANQLKSFSVQRGLRAIFISNWFDSRLVVQSPIYSITSATLSSPLWSAAHQSPERLTKRVPISSVWS